MSASASAVARRRPTREIRPGPIAAYESAAVPLPSCQSTLDVPVDVPRGASYDHAREMAALSVANLVRPTSAFGAISDEPSDRVVAVVWGVLAALLTIGVVAALAFGPLGT